MFFLYIFNRNVHEHCFWALPGFEGPKITRAVLVPFQQLPGVTPHSLRTWKMLPAVLKPCRRVAEVRKELGDPWPFNKTNGHHFPTVITVSGWWFGTFFIFHYIWDNPSHWVIFFKMVKTTNQVYTVRVFCVCFKMKHSKNHEEWGEWGLSAVRRLRSFYKQGTGRGHDVAILRRSPGRAAWIDLDFLGLDRLDRDHDQTCLIGIPWAGPACWATTASSTRSSWRWPPFLGVENGAWKIQPIWENQGHLRKINGWVGGFSTFSCHSDGFYLIPSLPNVNLLEKARDFGIYLFGVPIWYFILGCYSSADERKEFTQFCWIGQWLGAAFCCDWDFQIIQKKVMFQRCFCGFLVNFRCFHPDHLDRQWPLLPPTGGLPWGWTWFLDVVRNQVGWYRVAKTIFSSNFYHLSDYTLLLGGEEHGFYDFPYTRNNHPNWRTHIFQRGWNHQPDYIDIDLYFLSYIYIPVTNKP